MELRSILRLEGATIVDLTKYPRNPEPSRVLVITAPLKPSIAKVLKCESMAFDINEQPNKFEGGFGLPHELIDVEVKLEGSNGNMISLFPKVVRKFRIGHDAKDKLTITLRAHFQGYGSALDEWSDDINDKAFTFQMLSTQGELFPEATAEDGAAGGTRVEMSNVKSGDDPDTGCISCNNGIPFEDGENTTHASGMRCTRTAESSTLASAREAAGGTHAKGGRKQRRQPQPEPDQAIADAEAEESAMPVH